MDAIAQNHLVKVICWQFQFDSDGLAAQAAHKVRHAASGSERMDHDGWAARRILYMHAEGVMRMIDHLSGLIRH